MAKIKTINVVNGISGKYGKNAKDYFATNSTSNKIRLAKLEKPFKGPASEKQLEQQARFAARQAAVSEWLNANKPNEANGPKGTELYQYAMKLKQRYSFSNINQVLYKYMDEDNVINLPNASGKVQPFNSASPKTED